MVLTLVELTQFVGIKEEVAGWNELAATAGEGEVVRWPIYLRRAVQQIDVLVDGCTAGFS